MSKKIDIKSTLGKSVTPLSIDAVEEMTRLIHDKKSDEKPEAVVPPASAIPPKQTTKTASVKEVKEAATSKYEKTTVINDKGKRGRKPKMMVETERLLRVSVDLPESLFIQLKVCVIQQKTDMKTFIRKMIEKEMEKQNR